MLVADPWFKEKYGSKVSNAKLYDYTFELTAQEWDDIKPKLTYQFDGPYKGMKVNDMGFWNLIKDQAGSEAYEFLSVAGGYYSNTINWNAAEAFPYMVGDFSKLDVGYKTISQGYDQIISVIAQTFAEFGSESTSADQVPRAKFWGQNRLESFKKADPGSRYKYVLTFHNVLSGKHWTVYANAIVLAMPQRSLELLDQENFFFNPDTQDTLQKNIASVIREPSFKLLLGFESPWWTEQFHALHGESLTDLPMRQCYYFGVEPENGHAILLSSYNDMRTVGFWSVLEAKNNPSRSISERHQPRPTAYATREALEPLSSLWAPKVMVQEAVNQLRELHGIATIPEPYVALLKDWTQDPFGGGYHAWKAGQDVQAVMQYMRQPDANEAIHICGEAYSDQQGWVEGAFCVAEHMVQDHFGLDWPSWLPDDDDGQRYYLGW